MLLKLSHISSRKYPKMMYCPKKPKKPKSQRLLRLCLAPPLQESLRFGFFGFFGTVHHFGLVMVINLGQLQQNAWFSKKIQHNCKVQGPNPDPTYSYERRAGTVTRLRGIRFFEFSGTVYHSSFLFVSIMCFSNEIWHSTSFFINI